MTGAFVTGAPVGCLVGDLEGGRVVGATVTGDAEVGLAVLGALEGVEVTGALVGEGVINGAMGLGVGASETGASETGASEVGCMHHCMVEVVHCKVISPKRREKEEILSKASKQKVWTLAAFNYMHIPLRLGQEYLVALEWEDLTELQEWEMELVAA